MDRTRRDAEQIQAHPAPTREQPAQTRPMELDTGEGMLIPAMEAQQLRDAWQSVQTTFVDDPQQAVHRADDLVKHLVRTISDAFDTQRARLEERWSQGDQVSTEDLRVAVQRYRSFFQRLLEMRAV